MIITQQGIVIRGTPIRWEEFEKILLSGLTKEVSDKFKTNIDDLMSYASMRFNQTEDLEYLNEIASLLKVKQGLLVKPLKVKIKKKIKQLFEQEPDLKVIKI